MNKKAIGLVSLVVALGVLFGVYVFIKPEEEVAETPTEEKKTYEVLTVQSESVDLVEYRTESGGEVYTFTLKADKSGWTWTQDAEIPLANADMTALVSSIMALTSNYCVVGVTEETLESTYGITENGVYVHTHDAAGDVTVRFGKINSYNSLQYVARDDQPDRVYLISASVVNALEEPTSMIQEESLPSYTAEKCRAFSYKQGEDATVTYDRRENEEYTMLYTRVCDGASEEVDDIVGDDLFLSVTSLTYGRAVTFHAGEWDTYGVGETPNTVLTVYYTYTQTLTDPTTEQEFTTERETNFRLYIGNKTESGTYYVRLAEGTGVYALNLGDLGDLLG